MSSRLVVQVEWSRGEEIKGAGIRKTETMLNLKDGRRIRSFREREKDR